MDDLVRREGTYYKKFSDVPFTGQVEGKEQGSFKNGLKEGSWVNYWDNGQLKSKGSFKNGNRDGSWVAYWEYGQLFYKGDYKNDEEEGYWVVYFEDGSVWPYLTGTFKDGVKISD